MSEHIVGAERRSVEQPAEQTSEGLLVEGKPTGAGTASGLRFAFYGRVSTEDNQDPSASRAWQLRRAHGLIEPRGGVVVAEFFDVDKSRSIPWQRRPDASALIEALKNPGRVFDAVVVGEPHRAFYGNQYSLTFPLFEHFQVPLWVPEVGGPIDPANEAHDMIMGVFGGLSKGERNRIKIRVRSSMAAITATEGRFLGGRPPYGYKLVDAGPHPNPAKAADGKRMRRLVIDEFAATVVQRIFAEFLGLCGSRERGYHAIAEGLTRDGVPCPSAHDPVRNPHRSGTGWSKHAVRTILQNPRYTGYQVWNKQRKDEVLMDVDDVALGHTTKQRWNPRDQWVFSEEIVHPVIIDMDVFERAQHKFARTSRATAPRQRSSKRCYPLKGAMWCGACGRKMQAHYSGTASYYRCRAFEGGGSASKTPHAYSVYVREEHLLPNLDRWLGRVLAPHRIAGTIEGMQRAETPMVAAAAVERARYKVTDCDARLERHRAALEAGKDSATIARWIAEIEAEKTAAEGELHEAHERRMATLNKDPVVSVARGTDELGSLIAEAEPHAKERLYERLGLRVVYFPDRKGVRVDIEFDPGQDGYLLVSSRDRGAAGPALPSLIRATASWPLRTQGAP